MQYRWPSTTHGADRPVSHESLLSKPDLTEDTSAKAPDSEYFAASVLPTSIASGTSPWPDSVASRLVRWLPQVCHWMLTSAPVLALKAAFAWSMIAIHLGLFFGSCTSHTLIVVPAALSFGPVSAGPPVAVT